MKCLKILGLSALAALALVAVVGSSTASATVCSTAGAGEACGGSHGKAFTGTITASSTNATFTSGFTNITCSSHAGIEVTNAKPGSGEIKSLTYSSCVDNSGQACTFSATGLPWSASFAFTSGTSGTMTVLNWAFTFTCMSFGSKVTCNYGAVSTQAGVTGSDSSPVIQVTGAKLLRLAGSHFLCSAEATWSGTYSFSSPSSLFIVNPPSRVCSTAGAGEGCGGSHGNQYDGDVTSTVDGSGDRFTSGFINVTCHSHMTIDVTSSGTGDADVKGLNLTSCIDNFGRGCTNAAAELPWAGTFSTSGGPSGSLTLKNIGFNFTCKNPNQTSENVNCNYAAASAATAVTGSDTAPKLTSTNVKLIRQAGSSSLCSSEGNWSAAYIVSSPSSLFIT